LFVFGLTGHTANTVLAKSDHCLANRIAMDFDPPQAVYLPCIPLVNCGSCAISTEYLKNRTNIWKWLISKVRLNT